MMEGVPQVSIVDTPHPHDNVTYLTTVAVCRGGEEEESMRRRKRRVNKQKEGGEERV